MKPMVHVDDDDSFLRSMDRRLRGHGYTVATYPSVAHFFKRPDTETPGCVLADLQMPKRDGFDLQMLLGIVKGMQNRDMAEVYGLSERTVKYHRTMLTRRLNIFASVDLTRLVQDAGMSIEELAAMASATAGR